jgi:hypothetical protein
MTFVSALHILPDTFQATPQSSQRLIPIASDDQGVASVAALRETKMSSSVSAPFLPDFFENL